MVIDMQILIFLYLRYLDCLQENVKKGPWSEEEVELLKRLVEKYGVGK